ncbi:PAS domain S-box protein [Methanogenium organophilum]|uniref:PAS domain S-box protein n=2 Tax=Methanogenium organophilum TaxID=2199 RepID=A0A9X9S6E7_METOG|nr:PAS domain S-box protein [Methanogenium organophilum]WAI02302.1 PAS domain S-box protein [Methanogenium organophilum]
MEEYQEKLIAVREFLREKSPQQMSISAISRSMGMNRGTVSKYLEILRINGQVTMVYYGKSKLYTVSDRIPAVSLFDYTTDIIIIMDANARIMTANKSFFSKYNRLNERTLVGSNIFHLGIPIFSESSVHKNINRMIRGDKFLHEMQYIDERNNQIYSIKFIPTVSLDGNKNCMIALRDITDQIHTEEALSISDEKLRTIFKKVPSGILFFNESGNIINANSASLRMLGVDNYQDLMKTNLFDLFCRKEKIINALFDGDIGKIEFICDFERLKREQIMPTSRSGIAYFEASFTHISSETGFREYATIIMDVTAERMAKKELKFNESRYHSFFNYTCTGVLIYQPVDGGNDFMIKDVNQALEIILQVKKEEIIGKKLFVAFPDLPISSVRLALNRVNSTEIPEVVPPLQYIKNETSPWLTHFIFKLPTGEIASFMMDIAKDLREEVTYRKTLCTEND